MKFAIIGGGPAGLYFAHLLKIRRPDWHVTVLERSSANATWGFGVVLADGGLRQLEEADPVSSKAILAKLHWVSSQSFVVDGDSLPIDKARPGGSIERLTLLNILHRACADSGVTLAFDRTIENLDDLAGFDVVVGADGSNSLVRSRNEAAFGTRRRNLTNHFAWYGADKAFDRSVLNFKSVPGGALVGHYYPYASTRGTWVMECDDATWRALRLDQMNDEDRRSVTQKFFADELDGQGLLTNNSIWRKFVDISNERWYHDRYVLIGDALRTAHYSIGSGTRLAFEDAIALANEFAQTESRDEAFGRFAAMRRPSRAKLTEAGERSYLWYENYSGKMRECDPARLAYDFVRRTGRITPERLQRDFPGLVKSLVARGVPIEAPASVFG